MISITQIKIASQSDVLKFLTLARNSQLTKADRTPGTVLIDHAPSFVAQSESGQYIIKLIKPRKWHDRAKRLWRHSRLHKEIDGNLLLKKLGLCTPNIVESGSSLLGRHSEVFIGYYIMEDLTQQGFVEAKDIFENNPAMRPKILADVINGLRLMRDNHIVFSDFHLSNVMLNVAGELAWIDTGVTRYQQWYRRSEFKEKFNYSIQRLISYYSEGYFTTNEQALIRELLL